MYDNIDHVSQRFSKYSQKMFCEILQTDFTAIAALQKFRFAAAMHRERTLALIPKGKKAGIPEWLPGRIWVV